MNLQQIIIWTDFDKHGNQVGKPLEHTANSMVKGFLQLFYSHITRNPTTMKDVNGADRAINNAFYYADVNTAGLYLAPVADHNYGVLVGTSDQATSMNDYRLQSKIAHGSSAGSLYYNATQVGSVIVDYQNTPATGKITSEFSITRNFINLTQSGITIKEVGMFIRIPYTYSQVHSAQSISGYFFYLFDRSITNRTIGVGLNSTLEYKFSLIV